MKWEGRYSRRFSRVSGSRRGCGVPSLYLGLVLQLVIVSTHAVDLSAHHVTVSVVFSRLVKSLFSIQIRYSSVYLGLGFSTGSIDRVLALGVHAVA